MDLKGCVKSLLVQQCIREVEKKVGREGRKGEGKGGGREGRKGFFRLSSSFTREKLTTHQFRSPDVGNDLLHSSA